VAADAAWPANAKAAAAAIMNRDIVENPYVA
jgi:hypothetical protein